LSDEVLARLCILSKMHMICIWSSRRPNHLLL